MKKILLILTLFGFAVNLHAQQTEIPVNPNNQVSSRQPHFDKSTFRLNKGRVNAKTSSVDEFWLNYGSSIDLLNGGGNPGSAVVSQNYLFPDSLCLGNFGGTFSPVWIHHLGDILDVKSYIFNAIDNVTWDATTSYSVDSMSITYSYSRVDSVVDTLIVTLLTNAVSINMPGYYFTGSTAANYLTDTLSFKGLKYKQATNTINAGATVVIKIPLTDADTALSAYREKQFAVPSYFVVPADKLLGVDIQFKPGYSYALGDSIDFQHNAFYFASYEEFGPQTYQTYLDCNQLAPDCDYNCSFIVPHDVRYGTAGTWNNLFIPSYAYTIGYAYEHHLISYKVTSPPLGTQVNEITNTDFALGQNQPNPFTNETTISYKLKKAAAQVSVEIYDIRGVKMFSEIQSNLNPGKYSLDINTVNYAKGVYFCTLTVDGIKLTNKIVAQ